MPESNSWYTVFSLFEDEQGQAAPSPVVRGRDPRFYDDSVSVYSKALILDYRGDNGWFNLRYWGDDRWAGGRVLKRTAGCYILHFVYRGKGSVNGHPLKAGAGFLTVPGEPHVIESDVDEPLQFFWCLLYSNRFPEPLSAPGWLVFPDEKAGLFDFSFCYDAVCRLFRKGLFLTGETPFVSYGLYGLFFEIVSRCCSQSASVEENLSPTVRRAVDYIRGNYASDISVQALADSLHVSRAHLRRLFLSDLGVAPKEWITRCRIDAAVALMNGSGERSMDAVSHAVGFSCYSQFVRAFRQIHGCTPREYRDPASANSENE